MKKVLFISYFYPPIGGVASIRSVKYTKYLRDYGIEPVVLSVDPRWARLPKDKELKADIPKDISIYRTFHLDANWIFKLMYGLKLTSIVKWLLQNFLYPEAERTWLPFAMRKLNRVFKEHKDILSVFITAGPFSALELGLVIKQKYGVDYICEYRDQWINNPIRLNVTYPSKTLNKENQWQQRILQKCSGIIYLTELMHQDMCKRMPFLNTIPHGIIPNGFDDDDFPKQIKHQYRDALHFVYLGSFYDRRQPDIIWQAITCLVEQGIIAQNKIAIDIIGKNTPSFVMGKYKHDPCLSDVVRFIGFQSHQDSIAAMMQADVLLLFVASGKHAESELTGKLFEYIRSGRPILAIVPENGLAAEIIRQTKTGFIADTSSLDAICKQLSLIYGLWQKRSLGVEPDMDYIARYSRRANTAKLAELIHQVTDKVE